MYSDMLKEMIELLLRSDNRYWANWFTLALEWHSSGEEGKSYDKVLQAYGGMGSFNDVFWDLPKDEYDRLKHLKGEVWKYAKERS